MHTAIISSTGVPVCTQIGIRLAELVRLLIFLNAAPIFSPINQLPLALWHKFNRGTKNIAEAFIHGARLAE